MKPSDILPDSDASFGFHPLLFEWTAQVTAPVFLCCSERAALDASQVRDLEGILNEARQLEAQLQEKKDNLKHTLVLIADKLKG